MTEHHQVPSNLANNGDSSINRIMLNGFQYGQSDKYLAQDSQLSRVMGIFWGPDSRSRPEHAFHRLGPFRYGI
jgi:hypothetical protein